MRVLFLSNEFPNWCDPTKAVFNLQMVTGIQPFHDVRVVSPIAWTDEVRARLRTSMPGGRGGREAFDTPVPAEYPRYWYTPGVLRRVYATFFAWSTRGALDRLCSRWRPDVVLSYWAHPDGLVAADLAHRLDVPSVLVTGGSDLLVIARDAARLRLVRRSLHAADAVVAVSRHLRARVIELGVPAERVHVLYRGVDRHLFAPGPRDEARRRLGLSPDTRLLLWVGRLVPVKDVDSLLRAFAALPVGGIRLCLVGEGPERQKLERLARSLGVSGRVTFVGAVSPALLPDWYRSADLTVLSSRSEGVPNVLLESAACGTPFVATDVGGVSEIADPHADVLVPARDSDALARALAARLSASNQVPRTVPIPSSAAAARQLAALLSALCERDATARPSELAV